MRIGAHVSTSGGIQTAIDRALTIGANCVQIFAGPPQRWAAAAFKDEDVAAFRTRSVELDILPVFIHSAYLINPASTDPILRQKSMSSLLNGLQAADRLGAAGVITHLGSSKDGDLEQAELLVAGAISSVLGDAPPSARLLLETCAGQGNTIGRRFEQIGTILARCDDPRLQVCLDTAHIFEAGYDVTSAEGLESTIEQFDRFIGLSRLAAIHVNDSKTPLSSNVDRHENIGMGLIGEDAFARILHHPALRPLPFLLEVPGLTNEGPDRPNVETLRRLAGLSEA